MAVRKGRKQDMAEEAEGLSAVDKHYSLVESKLLGCWKRHDAILQQKTQKKICHDFYDNPIFSKVFLMMNN